MSLLNIIQAHAPQLRAPATIIPVPLLRAIADVETGDRDRNGLPVRDSGGLRNLPRFEPAYAEGGHYWRRAPHVRLLYERWGAYAACSYSSWQIMYVVAHELGLPLDVDPAKLRDDAFAAPWVVKMLNLRIFGKGAQTIRDVGDGWNSGSFADANVPESYIRDLQHAYDAYVRI